MTMRAQQRCLYIYVALSFCSQGAQGTSEKAQFLTFIDKPSAEALMKEVLGSEEKDVKEPVKYLIAQPDGSRVIDLFDLFVHEECPHIQQVWFYFLLACLYERSL